MTVNQFDPKQTTTLEIPSKIIAQQAVEQAINVQKSGAKVENTSPRIGFISLG
jgi:ribosomal protein S12 methylthiotransferase